MKTYLFQPLIFLSCAMASCVLASCGGNDSPEEEAPTLPFRYSIVIKDKDGLVLSVSERYASWVDSFYSEKDIRLIPYPQGSFADPLFSISDGDGERESSRIVVATEFNDHRQGGRLDMILELVEVQCAFASPPELYHIYTYDTIRCDLKVSDDSVVCEKISVNDVLSWENDGNRKEEPCITLIKKHRQVMIGGLE
ncbi:MAG: hypothetical protein LBC19_00975 [Tannerella sp.]|jgi:hypothetical protein|nr:hypothetical protein [Tannerella sp.]